MSNERARTTKLLGIISLMAATALLCTAVRAEPSAEIFPQLLEQWQHHPGDQELRERIIKAAREQRPAPAIPEEARRFYIRGRTALEDAQGQDGYLRAIRNYEEALKIAPWWADAYGNLAKARDLAKDYSGAIAALELYLLAGPAPADARQAQDRIYALEEKRDERRDEQQVPAARAAPAEQAPAPQQVMRSVPVASNDTNKPGEIFKDCPECPEMVVVNRSYAIGKFLVTQKLWRDVMGGNPSFFQKCGDDCPVENVSWNDAQEFLAKLYEKTGKKYGLPTQAQWESACHAGSATEFCGAQQFETVAWFLKNSGARTHPVGQKQPNGLGLYDMNGNVWEWTDECSNDDCRYRILRGGSWTFDPQYPRAHKRIVIDASLRSNDYGLRLTRALP